MWWMGREKKGQKNRKKEKRGKRENLDYPLSGRLTFYHLTNFVGKKIWWKLREKKGKIGEINEKKKGGKGRKREKKPIRERFMK